MNKDSNWDSNAEDILNSAEFVQAGITRDTLNKLRKWVNAEFDRDDNDSDK